eukprot:TRINITY_DN42595_c0_g1_i1.p1 TRINITY_DN42595_c0_g1~~TRINITY_DN42595_c0_g1_i1.p1  ORF type:complete len:266 (+),score=26.43 TRINITY_DN42595_c0_g1_i1:54-800(+)
MNERSRLSCQRGGLNSFADINLRHGFVQKVYGILSLQLLLTFAVSGRIMVLADGMIKQNKNQAMILLWSSFAMSMGMMCVFMCAPHLMRSYPTNYVLLFLFTLAKSITLGFICAMYTRETVLLALGLTTAIVVALTLFACQTSSDFTGSGPYLFVSAFTLFGFGFMLSLTSWLGLGSSPAFQTLRLIYACCGAMLFSCFLVYDTQLIVGGEHKRYQFSIDDYAMAAIVLYMDIVQLFQFLLQILGRRR